MTSNRFPTSGTSTRRTKFTSSHATRRSLLAAAVIALMIGALGVVNGTTNTAQAITPASSASGGASLCYGQIVVSQQLADTMTVIDQQSNLITRTLPTPDQPGELEFSGDGRFFFVPSYGANTITVFDSATGSALRTIQIQDTPTTIVSNHSGSMLWVGTMGNQDQLHRVNAETGAVLASTPVFQIYDLYLSPDETTLWVVVNPGFGGLDVSERNASTLAQTATTPSVVTNGWNSAINPAGTKLYFADWSSTGVVVYDTATRAVSTLGAQTQLYWVTVSPDGNTLYGIEGGYLNHSLVAIDATTGQSTPGLALSPFFSGGTPIGITVTADGSKVVVSHSDYAQGGMVLIPTSNINSGTFINTEIYRPATVCPLAADPSPPTTLPADPVVPTFTG